MKHTIIHKNGDLLDLRRSNLEIKEPVTCPIERDLILNNYVVERLYGISGGLTCN